MSFSAEQIDAGRKLFGRPARFIQGVASLDGLPPMTLPEIAFAGRSNVGKSSLINALTGVNGLARASNTPGRTRELNLFGVGEGRFILVDMPGYGFAKASRKEAKVWQSMMRGYLRGRQSLKRCFVLIDSRHGILSADREMFDLLDEAAVTFQIVLTKADKLKTAEQTAIEQQVAAEGLKRAAAYPTLHMTSSEKGLGIDTLRAEIAAMT